MEMDREERDKIEDLMRLKMRLMFTCKRRRQTLNNAVWTKRTIIQKKINHRKYLHRQQEQRQKTAPAPLSHVSSSHSPRSELSNVSSNSDWWERVVLAEFGPQEWLQRFHVSKDTFYLLCNTLKPQFPQAGLLTSSSKLTLPLEKRVAVALIRLATNMDYSLLSELFSENINTLSQCVREVCDAIIMLLKPLYMHHPGAQELAENARAFHMKWGFPHCVGVIDTLHIPIRSPPLAARECWRSKTHGNHSVVMQGVVNAQGCFWDVCVGFPGGTDDATVLQSSELWIMARDGGLSPQPPLLLMGQPVGYLLLGDEGYPLHNWLMKSYPSASQLTPPQCHFNSRLNDCRTVIDTAFSRLRARWQCTQRRSESHLELVPMMALACCVLHNVCEMHGDPFRDEWLEEVREPECTQPTISSPAFMDDPNAEQVRGLLCGYFQMQQQSKVPLEQEPPPQPPPPLTPAIPFPIPYGAPPHGGMLI